MNLLQRLALPLLRSTDFKGKFRLENLLGFDFADPHWIPPSLRWVDCIDGIRMTTATPHDLMFLELFLHRRYQDDVVVALEALLTPGSLLFDVGANYGFMSIHAARAFRGEITVVAWEPNPTVADHLDENISVNGVGDYVHIDRRCLSDQSGEIDFYISPSNSWNATLVPGFAIQHSQDTKITVETIRLDDAVAQHGEPDVLKIDVEGAEHLVVAGGADFLARRRPPLVVEYNMIGIEHAGLEPESFLRLFSDLGYTAHVMPRPRVGRYRWESLRTVRAPSELPNLCNLVFMP